MGTVRKTPAGAFELRIAHRLLPKTRYFTFDDEAAARAFDAETTKWLAAGVVPAALAGAKPDGGDALALTQLIQLWRNTGHASATDDAILGWMLSDPQVKPLSTAGLTYAWCEGWVGAMKLGRNLAPSSIRQRVQALARAIDWFLRKHPAHKFANPLRLLPRGYASYTAQDKRALEARGRSARYDQARERRLLAGEEGRIRAALAGEKRPDRERALPLPDGPDLRMLFEIIMATGARLREAYTLRVEDIDLSTKVLRLRTTKQRHGKVTYREVPILPSLFPPLRHHVGRRRKGLLLSLWNGDPESLRLTSNRLSARFRVLFDYAQCEGLVEHDLRHEATCRWLELRDKNGGWLYRTAEIRRIMGWAPNSPMAARYASFRAESLADRLWETVE